jgi:flavodoxin
VRDPIDRTAKVLVAYYSATGHVHALAKAVAAGAEEAVPRCGCVTWRSSHRRC